MEADLEQKEAETALIKYVFLDVVGFTKDRSTEAQVDIIEALNGIVSGAIRSFKLRPEDVIFLPTGDGMCIALVSVLKPYDIHVLLALKIIDDLNSHNLGVTNKSRSFHVRIGINECDDTLVTDINGHRNVAGMSINMASRIMGLADQSQILVSVAVFEKIKGREKYAGKLSEFTAQVKHRHEIKCYQLTDKSLSALNSQTPSTFAVEAVPETKLTRQMAIFIALCHKHRDCIQQILKKDAGSEIAITKTLLWLTADDLCEEAEAKPFENPIVRIKGRDRPLPEQLADYTGSDFWFCATLADYLQELHFNRYSNCFEQSTWGIQILAPKSYGIEKLKKEFPKTFSKITGT